MHWLLLFALASTTLVDCVALEWPQGTAQAKVADYTEERIPFVLPFRNDSDQVLLIDEIKNTCSCIVDKTVLKPYAPGEEGVVSATVSMKGIVGSANRTLVMKYRLGYSKSRHTTF